MENELFFAEFFGREYARAVVVDDDDDDGVVIVPNYIV